MSWASLAAKKPVVEEAKPEVGDPKSRRRVSEGIFTGHCNKMKADDTLQTLKPASEIRRHAICFC